MIQLTLPGLVRKRRDLRAEAAIPCATGTRTTTATATHLAGDRDREPSFADLIAGNDREPSHTDLTADDAPAEQPRPKAYPGVAIDTMAWLREQDIDGMATVAARAAQWLRAQASADKQLAAPAAAVDGPPAPTATEETPAVPGVDHDEHAFDVDHLVPVELCTVDLTRLDTDEELTVPAGSNPRLLFDALDALDRLPSLYSVDAKSFEMAASIAAIQTYAALRPDLLGGHGLRMQLAPLVAQLAEPDPEPAGHCAQLAAAWASIREANTRFAAHGFVPDRRFHAALELDALDELIDELAAELGDVRCLFDAEADAIELYAIEAGLPPLADWERKLLALPEGEPDPGAERAFADMDATADAIDAWYAEQSTASIVPGLRVVDNVTGAAGTVIKTTLDRALVRLDRAPEGLTPFSFFALSPESAPNTESEA